MNFHAKSQISRSKNGWDMAVGTKEDTHAGLPAQPTL